jgi:hypothetical protein
LGVGHSVVKMSVLSSGDDDAEFVIAFPLVVRERPTPNAEVCPFEIRSSVSIFDIYKGHTAVLDVDIVIGLWMVL